MKPGKGSSTKQAGRRNRAGLFLFLLVLLGAGAAGYLYLKPALAARQASAVAGEQTFTTPVKRGDLKISAAGSGKLVANQSVDLSFSTSGTVADLKVELGDTVKAGQELASLENSQTLEANLASAKLQVLTAQQALNDLQKNSDLSLAQAYSDLVAAQQAHQAAQEKVERVAYGRCGKTVRTRLAAALDQASKRLAGIHAETNGSDAFIAAKKAYDTALANVNECASYTADEKNSLQSALEVSETALKAAQDQYDTLKAASGIDPDQAALAEANLKAARARLTLAEDRLAGATLTAPIDGKVTYLAAQQGALAGTGKFITIADVSHSILEISVDESDIDKLLAGAPLSVTFDALPDMSFTGKVIQVYPEMVNSGQYRIAKGLAELDADAVKTISALPLGLSATVTIQNQEARDVLLAPVIALKDLGDNTYGVMVKGSDGALTLKPVTIGIQDQDYVEIKSGLQEGEQVSTGKVNFIAAGSSSSSTSLKNAQDAGNPFPGEGGMPPAP